MAVHYKFPPTSDDIETTESVIRKASQMICDATDGQMRLGTVWVGSSTLFEREADVWLMPPGSWNRARNSGFLPLDDSRIWMNYDAISSFQVLAHELLHGIFLLADAYDEQNRSGRYDGIGWALDPGVCTVTGDACVVDTDCEVGGGLVCQTGICGAFGTPCASDSDCVLSSCEFGVSIDDQNNSIMGYDPPGRPRCGNDVRPGGGSTPSPIGNRPCRSGEIDCYASGATIDYGRSYCKLEERYSELSVPSNHDQRIGSSFGAAPICPNNGSGTAGREVVFGPSRLGEDVPDRGPGNMLDLSSPAAAENTSDFTIDDKKYFVMDSVGLVDGYDRNSLHRLRVYIRNEDDRNIINRDRWSVTFTIKDREFENGSQGDQLRVVARYDLIFDTSTPSAPGDVYAPTGDAAFPLIRVDFGGVLDADPIQINGLRTVFVDGDALLPGPLSLDVDFSNLVLLPSSAEFRVRMEVLGSDGRQQRGSCLVSNGASSSLCSNDCDLRYNVVTDRWETAENTTDNWRQALNVAQNRFPSIVPDPDDAFNFTRFVTPQTFGNANSLPVADNTVECDQAGALVDIRDQGYGIRAADDIVLAFDFSCSMADQVGSLGDEQPKIDWARASVRGLVELFRTEGVTSSTLGDRRRLGLVAFSSFAEAVPLEAWADPNGNGLNDGLTTVQTLLGAISPFETCSPTDPCPSGEVLPSDINGAVGTTPAEGNTAIFAALLEAESVLDSSPETCDQSTNTCRNAPAVGCAIDRDCVRGKAVVVLSDGLPNVPGTDGDCCNTEDARLSAVFQAGALRARGIQVFAVPFGDDGSTEFFGALTDEAGGESFPAPSAKQLPAVLGEVYARLAGGTPVLALTPFSVQADDTPPPVLDIDTPGGDFQDPTSFPGTNDAAEGSGLVFSGSGFVPQNSGDLIGPPAPQPSQTFVIPVERDATELTILISTRMKEPSNFNIAFRLGAPDGIVFTEADSDLVTFDPEGSFFEIIRIPSPRPGLYRLEISDEVDDIFEDQLGYVTAWTLNDGPDCYAYVSDLIVPDQTGSVEVTARATWFAPLERATMSARVTGPTGVSLPLALTRDDASDDISYRGSFTGFEGRGRYQVDVSCDVANGTREAEGETLSADEALTEGEGVGAPELESVGGFTRNARANFVVVGGPRAPLPPGDDCDNDGLDNATEGVFCPGGGAVCIPPEDAPDTDGDGIIDACDPDSDNDDVPDRHENPDDIDGDGLPGHLDPDSDGDGNPDATDPDPHDPGVGGTKGDCDISRALLAFAIYLAKQGDYAGAMDAVAHSMQLEFALLDTFHHGSLRSKVLQWALIAEWGASHLLDEADVNSGPHAKKAGKKSVFSIEFAHFLKGFVCAA